MDRNALRVIKLVTGEELIGSVKDGSTETSDDDNYTLDNLIFIINPMKIVADYNAKTKTHSLYLMDWIPAISDVTFPIDKQRILTLGSPNRDLENHYIDILLSHRLLQDLQASEDEFQDTHTTNDVENEKDKDLVDKLKKHKFDDDDIQ